MRTSALHSLIDDCRLIIACGPGGVGKTTTSAAIALHAAELGKKCLVMTIDPARRLATCLGLEELGCYPSLIDRPDRPGEMWAMMLDTQQTFDDLVDRLAPDEATAGDIKNSALYSIFAGSMHGTTEYMALEGLYDAYTSGNYDLIVLDTPPLTNALDFFKVPNRAAWIFDERVMRWFTPHTGRTGLRGLIRPGAVVMRLLKYLAGPNLVDDITDFFSALGVIGGQLKRRGEEVSKILRRLSTRYVVITGAAERRIDEALFLDDQLRKLDQAAELFVINRSHHIFGTAEGGGLDEGLNELGNPDLTPEAVQKAAESLVASGRRQAAQIETLVRRVGAVNVCPVEDLPHDISSMEDLKVVSEALNRAISD